MGQGPYYLRAPHPPFLPFRSHEHFLPAAPLTQLPRSPTLSRRAGPAIASAMQGGRCLPLVQQQAALAALHAAAEALRPPGAVQGPLGAEAGHTSQATDAAVAPSLNPALKAWRSVAEWDRAGGRTAAMEAAALATSTEPPLTLQAPLLTVSLLPPALFPGAALHSRTAQSEEGGAASLLRPVALQVPDELPLDDSGIETPYAEGVRRVLCAACAWAPLPLSLRHSANLASAG